MSKAIRFCSMLLVFILLFGSVVTKAETKTAYVTELDVKLYASPTTDSEELATLSHTTVIVLGEEITGEEYPWYKVSYLNTEGYIYGQWLSINTPAIPLDQAAETAFQESLNLFPESYRGYLSALHDIYPRWKFVPDYFYGENKTPISFEDAVNEQYKNNRKHVELSQSVAWRSMYKNAFNWDAKDWKIYDSDRWVSASKEVIAYYMDPRNFLNNVHIYMFVKQSFDANTQTEAGLLPIIENTFLATPYEYNPSHEVDALYGGSYPSVIMAAANASGVNPYIIASKILIEQGKGESSLISGTYVSETAGDFSGYYNFFNWGASGEGTEAVIVSGLTRAQSEGWNSRATSIIEGAKKLSNSYISQNQDTYYYMAFNVANAFNKLNDPNSTDQKNPYWHQYESAVYAAYNKAVKLSKTYSSNLNAALEFRIPVYADMPDAPAPRVEKSEKCNNYYLTGMSAEGMSIPFDMYTQSYDLTVPGSTTLNLTTFTNATITSPTQIDLAPGTTPVTVTVQSETGFTNSYTLNLVANSPCTLTIISQSITELPTFTPPVEEPPVEEPPVEEPPVEEAPPIIKGDADLNGIVDAIDLAAIRLYLLEKLALNDTAIQSADINNDGIVDAIDLAGVRLYLLGKMSF